MSDEEIFDVKNDIESETELRLLQEILVALQNLNVASRKKLIRTLLTYFEISPGELAGLSAYNNTETLLSPVVQSISVEEFILSKQPQSDAERVACLAYYLTHSLGTLQFKSTDISKLNREAAQRKFANATKALDNATQAGYLIPALDKGARQLSATGELFVQALPDRAEVTKLLSRVQPKRTVKIAKK